MPTLTHQLEANAPADVLVPRQPTEEFLRSTMALLADLERDEADEAQRRTIVKIRYELRSHLAAFLLLADPRHQAGLAALQSRLEAGGDLGPVLTIEEF